MINKITSALYSRTIKKINSHRGWKTNRKIVVIESDDWGSIRMPSKEVYDSLLATGLRVDKCHYCKYDSLASREDFSLLFEVLNEFSDFNGNHPIITANTNVANPDFNKIKESNFKNYFYEPFTETLKKYPSHSFSSWKQGIEQKLFYPQYHGREHLNVSRWMNNLRLNSKETHNGFNNQLFGISSGISNEGNPSFMAALHASNKSELLQQCEILKEGLDLFERLFGYKSKSFIAPNYIWHPIHEELLNKNDVKYLQGHFLQFEPSLNSHLRKKPHYCGEKNNLGQIYLVRNCVFEPSTLGSKDWISSCLKNVDDAFSLLKPAIITSHRVNFISGISIQNRNANLNSLRILLKKIINKWPDVEFMTSVQLGDLISSTKNRK